MVILLRRTPSQLVPVHQTWTMALADPLEQGVFGSTPTHLLTLYPRLPSAANTN
jgi:hypothetical protein